MERARGWVTDGTGGGADVCAVGAGRIRRGDRLVAVLGSAHRDPARFGDPDVLDVRRGTGRHCGFGLGAHYRAGAALARLEAETGLAVPLGRLPLLRPGARPLVEGEYAPDRVFHGPSRLVPRARDARAA